MAARRLPPKPMAATAGGLPRSGGPPLPPTWGRRGTFFFALYVIVARIALPRVGAVIDARQNRIEGDLAEAQKLRDESEAALKAYEADLAAARSKAQEIGAETREKAN